MSLRFNTDQEHLSCKAGADRTCSKSCSLSGDNGKFTHDKKRVYRPGEPNNVQSAAGGGSRGKLLVKARRQAPARHCLLKLESGTDYCEGRLI